MLDIRDDKSLAPAFNYPQSRQSIEFASYCLTMAADAACDLGTLSARAAPFAPTGSPETIATLRLADSHYTSGWRAVGESYYFENCWWQRQQYYVNGYPTKKEYNRKLSCPDRSFSADRIQRPSPSFGKNPGRIKR